MKAFEDLCPRQLSLFDMVYLANGRQEPKIALSSGSSPAPSRPSHQQQSTEVFLVPDPSDGNTS